MQLTNLQKKAKQLIDVSSFDTSLKTMDERTEAVNVLFKNKEVANFFNECHADLDKRDIIDRMTYRIKKKQGGFKFEYNYSPLELAADYILSLDKTGDIQTRNSIDEQEGKHHQHNGIDIEVSPLSEYEKTDDEGATYLTIQDKLSTCDEYFKDTAVTVQSTKEFLKKYNIPITDEIVELLMLKENEDTAATIKEKTGLTERRQRTLSDNIAAIIKGEKQVEPVSGIEKTCKCCSEIKPLNEFAKEKRNKDGHKNICKKCDSQRKIENLREKRQIA